MCPQLLLFGSVEFNPISNMVITVINSWIVALRAVCSIRVQRREKEREREERSAEPLCLPTKKKRSIWDGDKVEEAKRRREEREPEREWQ